MKGCRPFSFGLGGRVQAMTCFEDMPPDERKRQREALRRRLAGAGLRPGLIQKWQAASSQQAKFEFLRAFMLDPQNLSEITIEAQYVDMAEHDDSSCWVELPLETLRKQYTTPSEIKFLEEQVIAKQPGRAHPQDPSGENQDMRMYWVFRESTDVSRRKQAVGHSVKASGHVPQNRAAMTAVADSLAMRGADFGGKGGTAEAHQTHSGKGKGGKAKGKTGEPPEKKRKAGHIYSYTSTHTYIYIYIIHLFIIYTYIYAHHMYIHTIYIYIHIDYTYIVFVHFIHLYIYTFIFIFIYIYICDFYIYVHIHALSVNPTKMYRGFFWTTLTVMTMAIIV